MEEDRRVAAAVGSAHEDMERMVEAKLHRELAVDARRLLGRSRGGLVNAFSLLRFAVGGAAAAIVATTIYVASPQIKALISDSGVAIAANPTPSSGDAEADAPATSSLTVAAEFVNLRAEPSQNATIVARL